MKKIIVITTLLISGTKAFAQNTAEFAVTGKQVVITSKNASLEITGTDDNKLSITPYIAENTPAIPADASGLQLIASAIRTEKDIAWPKLLENNEKVISIDLPESMCHHYRIKLPKSISLKVSFDEPSPYGKISFTNLSGELDASGNAPVINFSYVTGPVTLSAGETGFTTGASEQINFSHLKLDNKVVKNSPFINIISSYADISISLPKETKASLQVDSEYGNLYSAFNFIADNKITPVKNRYYGLLNGGGRMLTINSTYGNVFIRREE